MTPGGSIEFDPRHPHERDGRNEPPVLDGEGRCLVCRVDVMRAERDAAEARCARLEAIQKIARVQVDDEGDLWLHLDGGGRYKASFNVTAKLTHTTGALAGGVREATGAMRALLFPPTPVEADAPAHEAAKCATCGGTGEVDHNWPEVWIGGPTKPCPDCAPEAKKVCDTCHGEPATDCGCAPEYCSPKNHACPDCGGDA